MEVEPLRVSLPSRLTSSAAEDPSSAALSGAASELVEGAVLRRDLRLAAGEGQHGDKHGNRKQNTG